MAYLLTCHRLVPLKARRSQCYSCPVLFCNEINILYLTNMNEAFTEHAARQTEAVYFGRLVRDVQIVIPLLTLSRDEIEALENNSAHAPRIVAWDCPDDENSVDPFNNMSESDGEWEDTMFESVRDFVGFHLAPVSAVVPDVRSAPSRTDREIQKLLIGVPDAEGLCNICLDALSVDAVETACGHHYHLRCVQPWLRTHNTCPVCRSTLVRQDDIESILVATQ
jgi:hypothetical protein